MNFPKAQQNTGLFFHRELRSVDQGYGFCQAKKLHLPLTPNMHWRDSRQRCGTPCLTTLTTATRTHCCQWQHTTEPTLAAVTVLQIYNCLYIHVPACTCSRESLGHGKGWVLKNTIIYTHTTHSYQVCVMLTCSMHNTRIELKDICITREALHVHAYITT